MSGEKPLSAADQVLADALGRVIAELRAEWQRDLEVIRAEAKAAITEIRLVATELLLERHAPPDVIERLRIVGGRRD
jgi:hypothetical protein